MSWATALPATSYLEWAFLRWVLTPAARDSLAPYVTSQYEAATDEHRYRLDYLIEGAALRVAVELDGYAFHSDRPAFTYDRLRQNDLAALGFTIVRFSYDAIRQDTTRCVTQLQRVLASDATLAAHLVPKPVVEPAVMPSAPQHAHTPPPTTRRAGSMRTYFDGIRGAVNEEPLRDCQRQALAALVNYYRRSARNAACVMSVGAGKTALGVAATLLFTRRRALVVTPGSVIRGTFARAFNAQAPDNVLYGLPGGPIIPGHPAPFILTLDTQQRPANSVASNELQRADVIVTNFHTLGDGTNPGDLLAKLAPDDIDMIVVDEAHIAASDSYQRLFAHFPTARTLLLSACFQRADGRSIDADVVYRYRLIDSIADGHAKNLRVHRFAPDPDASRYQLRHPDGSTETIIGRDAVLDLLADEQRLARVTATSETPIRHIMHTVRAVLDQQATDLAPVKPRVLFAALGKDHAAQLARLACEAGIPTADLHHSMPTSRIRKIRQRFESDAGDLQGIVQLRMLGQGYDFPPISVVVPMRPYGSFGEFYQFVGRGIRVIRDARVPATDQYLDLVYHAELGLDDHIDTIHLENDMDPIPLGELDPPGQRAPQGGDVTGLPDSAPRPEVSVEFELGDTHVRIIHNQQRVNLHRQERERAALAQRYAEYAASNRNPIPFEQFAEIVRQARD